MEISKTKKEEEISVVYKGFEFVYGKGGIHGSVTNKLVEVDNEYVIIDADVASLYPSIAIVNGLYPQHLGPEFKDIYKKEIVDVTKIQDIAPLNQIKVLAYKDKGDWILETKYNIGSKKKKVEETE